MCPPPRCGVWGGGWIMASDLRDKLHVGMSYSELVKLLGEPSGVNEGNNLLKGSGPRIVSESTQSYLGRTRYCCWRRPEATYYLNITDDKLSKVHSIEPPISQEFLDKMKRARENQAETKETKKWWEFWKR